MPHFCPDWDYLWIEPGDAEYECCVCAREPFGLALAKARQLSPTQDLRVEQDPDWGEPVPPIPPKK